MEGLVDTKMQLDVAQDPEGEDDADMAEQEEDDNDFLDDIPMGDALDAASTDAMVEVRG